VHFVSSRHVGEGEEKRRFRFHFLARTLLVERMHVPTRVRKKTRDERRVGVGRLGGGVTLRHRLFSSSPEHNALFRKSDDDECSLVAMCVFYAYVRDLFLLFFSKFINFILVLSSFHF